MYLSRILRKQAFENGSSATTNVGSRPGSITAGAVKNVQTPQDKTVSGGLMASTSNTGGTQAPPPGGNGLGHTSGSDSSGLSKTSGSIGSDYLTKKKRSGKSMLAKSLKDIKPKDCK